MSFTHPDILDREDRAAELAHREHEAHVSAATHCEACEALLKDDRYDDGLYVVCATCAIRFASAFMKEILAASPAAIEAYTRTVSEPTSRGVA